jgi:ABC-2 type transport system permease protein
MIQSALLLVSGVYYSVEVLPGWLQALSTISPATYILEGIRGALVDGKTPADLAGTLVTLGGFGVLLLPGGMAVFAAGERWAKKTGRLKRQG